MTCTYTYKGKVYNSYQELVSAIVEEAEINPSILTNDILFSAQEDNKTKLQQLK